MTSLQPLCRPADGCGAHNTQPTHENQASDLESNISPATKEKQAAGVTTLRPWWLQLCHLPYVNTHSPSPHISSIPIARVHSLRHRLRASFAMLQHAILTSVFINLSHRIKKSRHAFFMRLSSPTTLPASVCSFTTFPILSLVVTETRAWNSFFLTGFPLKKAVAETRHD